MFTWLGDFEWYSGFHTEEEMGGGGGGGGARGTGIPLPTEFSPPPRNLRNNDVIITSTTATHSNIIIGLVYYS